MLWYCEYVHLVYSTYPRNWEKGVKTKIRHSGCHFALGGKVQIEREHERDQTRVFQ